MIIFFVGDQEYFLVYSSLFNSAHGDQVIPFPFTATGGIYSVL